MSEATMLVRGVVARAPRAWCWLVGHRWLTMDTFPVQKTLENVIRECRRCGERDRTLIVKSTSDA
jgi:hypothetical protein